ncbi:S8 family peptidase [Thiolapillus sp.]
MDARALSNGIFRSGGVILGLALCSGSVFAAGFQGIGAQDIRGVKSPSLAVKPGSLQAYEKAVYLVRLTDAAIASYRGGVQGLKATSPEAAGTSKLDAQSAAAVAYKSYLVRRHQVARNAINQLAGREVEVVHEYFYGNNGMAMRLTPAEAEKIKSLPEVTHVQRDVQRELHTDAGPAWIGAPDVWDGSAFPANQGEGIVVGVIDTGINPSNPSFADVGGDGYDHENPRGAGNYVGVCDPADASYDATFPCNDKLIGARGYDGDANGVDPRDYDGHGSHTASTAAGNHIDISVDAPTVSVPVTISGVAPHANIIAYAACCSLAGLTAAIDDAIADGVDVINYSIGSSMPSDVWNDFDTVGFRNARAAGIFVATSAGNAGPGANTVGSPADAPWLTAVGASTHDRAFENALVSMAGGGFEPPVELAGQSITAGYGPAPIVHAKDFPPNDPLCLNPYPAGTWSNNEIVVCDRGTNARVEKSANVAAGGAGGFVLANTAAQGESVNADKHTIPAVHLGVSNADTLRAWLDSGTGQTASIAGTTKVNRNAYADIMADFSSRGANRALHGVVKPDLSAPGVNILAATGVNDPLPAEWDFYSGTSMASPHVAGAGALLKGLYPDWSPAQIQSALASTGVTAGVRKEDGVTPADPFDLGGGVVDLAAVAANSVGLVLDETEADYIAADPASGGDPAQLNLASFGNGVCAGSCSWTRTFTSVADTTIDWTVSVTNPPGWKLTVAPSSFSIMPGAAQDVVVTAQAVSLPTPDWKFGQVTLTPSAGAAQTFPVALSFRPPSEPSGGYLVTTSVNDASCDTGFGGYIDLEGFGIFPSPSIVGDTKAWTAFGGQNPVSFYGVEYSGIAFSDDGFVMFDADSNYGGLPWNPQAIPDSALPNNLVAMLWNDLEIVYDDGTVSGQRRGVTLATNGPDVSIIEYDGPEVWGSGVPLGDFQIVVHSTVNNDPGNPEIVVAFDNLDPAALPALATVGVESPDGEEAMAYLNTASPAGLQNGLMVCFDYQPPPVGSCKDYWMLDEGSVAAAVTYQARKAVFAGGSFAVADGGALGLETSTGGVVQLFPGFSVASGGSLRVTVNAPAVCPI